MDSPADEAILRAIGDKLAQGHRPGEDFPGPSDNNRHRVWGMKPR